MRASKSCGTDLGGHSADFDDLDHANVHLYDHLARNDRSADNYHDGWERDGDERTFASVLRVDGL